MSAEIIAEIIEFWLGPSLDGPDVAAARRDWWYRGGKPVDDEIEARFGAYVADACAGKLEGWHASPEGALAMILLLDQFTRNLYRNTKDAYAGDERAYSIVNEVIERGFDRSLHPVSCIWLYHPFHHSERIADQDRGLTLLTALRERSPAEWHAYVERSITGWTRHRNIVAQFGRFPHRNDVLGRASSAEERAFLAKDGQSFGQGPVRVKDEAGL